MTQPKQAKTPDIIYIDALKVQAKVGVYEWEKKIEQTLFVDLALNIDLAPAGASDQLDDTLDYAAICEQVQTLAVARHYQLIEHFAQSLADLLLEESRVEQVSITVHKPAANPHAGKIGIKITRTRAE